MIDADDGARIAPGRGLHRPRSTKHSVTRAFSLGPGGTRNAAGGCYAFTAP